MVVDVTYNSMTFQESMVDCIRKVDTIIHEAEMGVMIDKYLYLQENGVILEGDQAKTSIKNRVRSMVNSVVRTIVNIVESAKKKLIAKFNAIKAKSDQKKAAKIDKVAKKTANTFDKVSNKFSDDMEEFYEVINLDEDDYMDDFDKVTENIRKRHQECANIINQAYHNIMENQRKIDETQDEIDDILKSISDDLDNL